MKGILFENWKIKAINEHPDIVTVTRRVVSPQPIASVSEIKEHSQIKGYWIPYATDKRMVNSNAGSRKDDCGYYPRYHVGEVVYIKEGYELYSILGSYEFANRANIKYLSDNFVTWVTIPIGQQLPKKGCHSPLFLPAWAARYFIKITGVRAERTRDITPEDCLLEGITFAGDCYWSAEDGVAFNTPREAYFYLYDSLNGKGAHENNWDWRYAFALRLDWKTIKPLTPYIGLNGKPVRCSDCEELHSLITQGKASMLPSKCYPVNGEACQ